MKGERLAQPVREPPRPERAEDAPKRAERRPRVHRHAGGRSLSSPPAAPMPGFDFATLRIHQPAGALQLRPRPGATHARGVRARDTALTGVRSPGQVLPFRERLQRAFGPDHDLSRVAAHIGGPAAEASERLGADGYAIGEHVAFREVPDLRLAAHEAAHIVQQRAGVRLTDNIGRRDDRYERAADAVAERVVQGRSAEDLLPAATAMSSIAVQLDEDDADPAAEYWQYVLVAHHASATALPPGPDKAYALRVWLLLDAATDTAFATVDEVSRFVEASQKTAKDEIATIQAVARQTGNDEEVVLLESSAAFPKIWSNKINQLNSGADEDALARIAQTSWDGVIGMGGGLSDDIWRQGLPLSVGQAGQLTLGELIPAVLNLDLARSKSEEATARYARAVLRWELAVVHYRLVHFHDLKVRRTSDAVLGGAQVIDDDDYQALRGASQVLQHLRHMIGDAGRGPARTIAVLKALEPTRFYRVSGPSWERMTWPSEAIEALWTQYAKLDAQIAGASSSSLIWRAGAWAYQRGFFGQVARQAWDAFVDDIPATVTKMLMILGLQAIPGINVLVDIVLICEFGIDILVTAAELVEVLHEAGAAKSLLDLEHASAHMATMFVGTAAKLLLWVITWGAAKGVGKIQKWRDAERFVNENSHTPEARTEARQALSDAKGDAAVARRTIEARRAYERQQQARAEMERAKAEAARQAKAEAAQRAEARRQAEAAAARRQAEEAAARQRAEQAARDQAEQAAARKQAEQAAARRQAEEAAARKHAEEAAARKRADEAAVQQRAEEAARRRAQQATRKPPEDTAAQQRAQGAAARKPDERVPAPDQAERTGQAARPGSRLPKSWAKFDSANNEAFEARLKQFRGNDDLDANFSGGEGRIFAVDGKSTALKRWFQSRLADMEASLSKLRRVRQDIESNPKLSADIEVVQIHEQGPDWILRDFDMSSVELKQARAGAQDVRARAINELEAMRARAPLSEMLADLLRKLRKNPPSANLHWSEHRQKILVIDMQ
jgi:hypothetical protein